MYKVEATTVIDAPVPQVYEHTASPQNGPVFVPNLNENFNISSDRTAVGQTWGWRYNFFGVDISGTAEVVEMRPNELWALRTRGDAESRWVYSFAPAGPGTRVALSIEYEMPPGKLAKVTEAVAERMNQRSCEQALENLKAWIEP
jgi:uncharacterized membrane protein